MNKARYKREATLLACARTTIMNCCYFLADLLAISFAAYSTLHVQPTQVGVQVYVDIAAKTAISQYWHDVPILKLQGHPNLQNGLAWYNVGNPIDHSKVKTSICTGRDSRSTSMPWRANS